MWLSLIHSLPFAAQAEGGALSAEPEASPTKSLPLPIGVNRPRDKQLSLIHISSSLQGISYALDSGALLAEALVPGLEGAAGRYAALTAPLRRQLGGKLLKNPFLYTPWIRKVILSTGIGSMAVRLSLIHI